MTLRSPRERVIQTLCYEAGGLVLATPLYSLVFNASAENSLTVMVAMSVAVMVWSPLHNTVFDLVEWRLAHRIASNRPHWLRMVHAASHEATTVVLTLPILLMVGGLSLTEAILTDLGLTGLYTVYAYGFHITYDRLRPIRA